MASKGSTTKRFGARYGRTIRARVSKIETELKKKHKCPYCHKIGGVKRIAIGIWHCKKCKSKFTGKAYSITKKIKTKGEELQNGI